MLRVRVRGAVLLGVESLEWFVLGVCDVIMR